MSKVAGLENCNGSHATCAEKASNYIRQVQIVGEHDSSARTIRIRQAYAILTVPAELPPPDKLSSFLLSHMINRDFAIKMRAISYAVVP